MNDSRNEPVQSAPPSPADVEQRVFEVVADQAGVPPQEVRRETRFAEIFDSLDQTEALMKLEDEFELSVPDADAESLTTVGQLIDYLRARCDARERDVAP